MSFLAGFVSLPLTHPNLGVKEINYINNEGFDSGTVYLKRWQVLTINLKKKKTDATKDFVKENFSSTISVEGRCGAMV